MRPLKKTPKYVVGKKRREYDGAKKPTLFMLQ